MYIISQSLDSGGSTIGHVPSATFPKLIDLVIDITEASLGQQLLGPVLFVVNRALHSPIMHNTKV